MDLLYDFALTLLTLTRSPTVPPNWRSCSAVQLEPLLVLLSLAFLSPLVYLVEELLVIYLIQLH